MHLMCTFLRCVMLLCCCINRVKIRRARHEEVGWQAYLHSGVHWHDQVRDTLLDNEEEWLQICNDQAKEQARTKEQSSGANGGSPGAVDDGKMFPRTPKNPSEEPQRTPKNSSGDSGSRKSPAPLVVKSGDAKSSDEKGEKPQSSPMSTHSIASSADKSSAEKSPRSTDESGGGGTELELVERKSGSPKNNNDVSITVNSTGNRQHIRFNFDAASVDPTVPSSRTAQNASDMVNSSPTSQSDGGTPKNSKNSV